MVEKVNVLPPLTVDKAVAGSVEVRVKSAETPVVKPAPEATTMVHPIAGPNLNGAAMRHETVDADVGIP